MLFGADYEFRNLEIYDSSNGELMHWIEDVGYGLDAIQVEGKTLYLFSSEKGFQSLDLKTAKLTQINQSKIEGGHSHQFVGEFLMINNDHGSNFFNKLTGKLVFKTEETIKKAFYYKNHVYLYNSNFELFDKNLENGNLTTFMNSCIDAYFSDQIVIGLSHSRMSIWNIKAGKIIEILELGDETGQKLYINDNKIIVSYRSKYPKQSTIKIWDLHSFDFLQKLDIPLENITSIRVWGDKIYTVSEGKLYVWGHYSVPHFLLKKPSF